MQAGTRPRMTTRIGSTERSRHALFISAVATLAVSLAVGVALVVGAACGSENPLLPVGSGAVGTATPTRTPTPTPTATPTATATPTRAVGTSSPTATAGGGGGGTQQPGGTATPDAAIILPCGDILVPLDKERRLPADCSPPSLQQLPADLTYNGAQYLRPDAAAALLDMIAAARAEGLEIYVVSSYRSYQTQVGLYAYWVSVLGEQQAARVSARPGHSEHQLGTTVDLSTPAVGAEPSEEFGDTPEGRWVAENSWRWGFIISYPAGKEAITGYAYEPWHVRWVGAGVASAVHASGLTLREYLLGR